MSSADGIRTNGKAANGRAVVSFLRAVGGLVRCLFALLVLAGAVLKLTLPSPQQRWRQQQQEWQRIRESAQQYRRQREQENLHRLQEQQRRRELEALRRWGESLRR
jgi:hypothetical protein